MPKFNCTVEVDFELSLTARDIHEARDIAEEIFTRKVEEGDIDIDVYCKEVKE